MRSIELVFWGAPGYEENLAAWPQGAVDEVGVGAGVLDRLQEQGLDVVGLNAGWAPIDKERFLQARAEWLWTLREVFEWMQHKPGHQRGFACPGRSPPPRIRSQAWLGAKRSQLDHFAISFVQLTRQYA